MKASHLPVAVLLLATALAGCGGAPLGLEKQRERLEAAQWALEMCSDAPARYRRSCSAEEAAYDAALNEYRAAAPR